MFQELKSIIKLLRRNISFLCFQLSTRVRRAFPYFFHSHYGEEETGTLHNESYPFRDTLYCAASLMPDYGNVRGAGVVTAAAGTHRAACLARNAALKTIKIENTLANIIIFIQWINYKCFVHFQYSQC